jgi:chromosome segregation ATPase
MAAELEQVKQDVNQANAEIEEIRVMLREAARISTKNTRDITNLTTKLDQISQQAERDRTVMRESMQQAERDRQQAERDRTVMRESIQQAERDRQQAERDRAMLTSAIQVIADMAAEMRSLRVEHDRVIQHLFGEER